MSAKLKELLLIDVTRGDCIEANRKSGKSNTGTYFLCSLKDFSYLKHYFEETNTFLLDLKKIAEYSTIFTNLFNIYMEEYIGKGTKFIDFSNYLLSLSDNPIININLRINDNRVFFRFQDNSNSTVNAFRNLLYEDLSYICIEHRDSIFYVYPLINSTKINYQATKSNNDDFYLDE